MLFNISLRFELQQLCNFLLQITGKYENAD